MISFHLTAVGESVCLQNRQRRVIILRVDELDVYYQWGKKIRPGKFINPTISSVG